MHTHQADEPFVREVFMLPYGVCHDDIYLSGLGERPYLKLLQWPYVYAQPSAQKHYADGD